MIKILHVIHGLNIGGAEGFIYNVIKSLNHSEYKFDFVIQNPIIGNKKIEDFIKEIAGEIFIITDFRKNILKHIKEYKKILANKYDYVHIHNNSLINPIPVIYGNIYGAKVILHSHNTANGSGGKLGKFIHNINKSLFIGKNTLRVACGKDAGKWMHGNNHFIVIPNAVDTERFKFSDSKRHFIRSKFNITNEIVIGHIGRFVPEKNQKFIIDLLAYSKQSFSDLKLKAILCGDGPLKREMELYAKDRGLVDDIFFVGNIDIPDYYYSAFDIFILPSLFEGLAYVAVEAQASGLSVIASNSNTREIDVTGNVKFISLNESFHHWIEIIGKNIIMDRVKEGGKLRGSNFDLELICSKLPYYKQ